MLKAAGKRESCVKTVLEPGCPSRKAMRASGPLRGTQRCVIASCLSHDLKPPLQEHQESLCRRTATHCVHDVQPYTLKHMHIYSTRNIPDCKHDACLYIFISTNCNMYSIFSKKALMINFYVFIWNWTFTYTSTMSSQSSAFLILENVQLASLGVHQIT